MTIYNAPRKNVLLLLPIPLLMLDLPPCWVPVFHPEVPHLKRLPRLVAIGQGLVRVYQLNKKGDEDGK